MKDSLQINFKKDTNIDYKKVELYQLNKNMYANEAQREALDALVQFVHSDEKEFCLIGRGGTGKTTIIKKLIEYYKKETHINDDRICGATVSHAAKNVLRDLVDGNIPTYTIAKLLGMKQTITEKGDLEFTPDDFVWGVSPPPIARVILLIIDECSMISTYLKKLIDEYKLNNCKIIYMGDNVQLPPIDKKRKADEDSITFKINPKAILTYRVRQGEDSPIVKLSDYYAFNIEEYNRTGIIKTNPVPNSARITNLNTEGKGVVFTADVSSALEDIISLFEFNKKKSNPEFCKVIAYRNTNIYGNAPYNIKDINFTIRNRLWDNAKEDQFVIGEIVVANNNFMRGGQVVFHNSDLFMVIDVTPGKNLGIAINYLTLINRNHYKYEKIPVVSKEGMYLFINKLKRLEKKAFINRSAWKFVYDFKAKFAEISYGYAITTHKAQGSTYENVFVFEDDIMAVTKTTDKEKNQAMYVAITRASNKYTSISKFYNK